MEYLVFKAKVIFSYIRDAWLSLGFSVLAVTMVCLLVAFGISVDWATISCFSYDIAVDN